MNKFAEITGAKVVGITEYKDRIIIATENGVYEVIDEDGELELKPVEFINE